MLELTGVEIKDLAKGYKVLPRLINTDKDELIMALARHIVDMNEKPKKRSKPQEALERLRSYLDDIDSAVMSAQNCCDELEVDDD